MKSTPLVTVIIPVYNSALYIEDALKSVFYQNYSNIEIYVIDDGSTDNTYPIIEKYQNRINIIRTENKGSAAARNMGLKRAKGKYIAFLDSDDIWLPGKLTAQVSYMEKNPFIKVTYGNFERKREDLNEKIDVDSIFLNFKYLNSIENVVIVPEQSGWVYKKLVFDSLPTTITIMMARDLLDEVGGFDENLIRGQDYDYWIRLSRVTEFHKLNRLMAFYRIHGKNITVKCMNINSELIVLEKALKKWGFKDVDNFSINKKELSKRLSKLHFNHGYQHFWHGDVNLALKSFVKSCQYTPFKIKIYAYMALSSLRTIYLIVKLNQKR